MKTLLLEAVDYQDIGRWRWVLTTLDSAPVADQEVLLDRSAAEYQGYLDLGAFVRRQGDPGDRLASEAAAVSRMGGWLGREVLGAIGDALVAAAPVMVLVRVPRGAEELIYRPLELAHVGGRPLALQEVSLVYEAGVERAPSKAAIGNRLRMLSVFSLPTGTSALGLRSERRSLSRLAREMVGRHGRAMELRVLQYGVTRERLREVLEEGEGWDVVHFSGHGLVGGLVLERADGSQDVVETGELVGLLRPCREQLKLVTLSSCSSAAETAAQTLRLLGIEPPRAAVEAEREGERPLPALAAELVGELGCAVLAMRYPVSDEFAIELGRELYERLLRQRQPLVRALQLALPVAVGSAAEPGRPAISVATPALFGRLAAELRLELPRAERLALDEDQLRDAGFPPEPPRLVGRVGPLARASAALAAESGKSGVLFVGMAGGGKTTCALEMAYRHQDNYRALVWYKAPDEGSDIGSALLELAQAMESRLPGLALVDRVASRRELEEYLPYLGRFLERNAVLVVVDNLESLLSESGSWRDERWGLVLEAMCGHGGLSRVVLTSRRVPPGLEEGMVVERIHALSLDESVLLARELRHLGSLLEGRPGVGLSEGRELVVRVLGVVQGHPKLIELADGAAVEVEGLRARLEEAEAAVDESSLRAFFTSGEASVEEAEQLRVLEGWTRGAVAGLSEGSRVLFWFLSCLEEGDRQHRVLTAIWGDLWARLGLEGEVPGMKEAVVALLERALVEVEGDEKDVERRVYRLHPSVAEAGRRQAGEDFERSVDHELATLWAAVFQQARKGEDEGLGGHVVMAARSALPYLARLQRWGEVSALVEQVLHRDGSPATLAAVLPVLRRAAAGAAGGELELEATGTLARALMRREPDEAERMLGDLMDRAAARRRPDIASSVAGALLILFRDRGRLPEALELAGRMAELSIEAGQGPWTQLADEVMRLQVLEEMGEYEQVLEQVETGRQRMATLPEQPGATEAVLPWNVRETLLDTGHTAAMRLKRWDMALTLVDEIAESERQRGASRLERTSTEFNRHHALVELGRIGEALELLHRCREVFEQEHAIAQLGVVFGALAQIEGRIGHLDDAVQLNERALRYKYLAGRVDDISTSHHNLARDLARADRPHEALAHSLAASLIDFQTHSGLLATKLTTLRWLLSGLGEAAPLPGGFDELCDRLKQPDGVRFRQLLQRLPQRAPSPDQALSQVLELARQSLTPDLDEHLRRFQPLLTALTAAIRGDRQARHAVDQALTEMTQTRDWAALATALGRLLAGERDEVSLLAGLDEIDAAVLQQALSAIATPPQRPRRRSWWPLKLTR